MAIKSILKPEGSMLLGGVTVLMVLAVYGKTLPTTAIMHATAPNDMNLEAGRKKATITAEVLLGAISLITRDANIFILGGLTIIALDWHARHANAASPVTGELTSETQTNRQLSVVPVAS
jgi:hypothetical protein